MRKIFLSILLGLGLITLAACNTKKKVDVTYQEANQMLESVNKETMLEDVFTLKGDFNIDYQLETKIGEVETSTSVVGKGSTELYIKATTYEEFYMMGKVNLNLTTQADGTKNTLNLNGNLYILENNLYLDGTLKTTSSGSGAKGDSTLDVKIKQLDFFNEEKFNEFKASLSTETDSPMNPTLTSESQFTLYEVKGGHLLEMSVKLDDFIAFFEGLMGDANEATKSFKQTGDNLVTIGMTFSDVIEKVDVKVQMHLEMNIDTEALVMHGHLNLNANLYIATKAKAPTKPNMDDLNKYEEGEVSKLFEHLPLN